MRLERMSWKDCEEYFKDHDMVILTTGSTENHGIHNPLGTDTMIPNKILELIEKQSDVLICPTGSLTLAHSRNSQMSFMYGFFFVKFLFFTVVCVVIVI